MFFTRSCTKTFFRKNEGGKRFLICLLQVTELQDRVSKLENMCKTKYEAGEKSQAYQQFTEKYALVRLLFWYFRPVEEGVALLVFFCLFKPMLPACCDALVELCVGQRVLHLYRGDRTRQENEWRRFPVDARQKFTGDSLCVKRA